MRNPSHASPVVLPFGGERDRPRAGAREKLRELKGLLAEKFPERQRAEGDLLPTGLTSIDDALGGGLPHGAISEVVVSAPSSGGQLLIASLLRRALETHRHLALVDGSDGFDPQTVEAETLPHLLWVRCRKAAQALQAADLLVRDGNLSPILLDLRGNDLAELRKQPPTVWFRLQRAVEQSGGMLLVLSARSQVSSAAVRLVLTKPLPLDSLDEPAEAAVLVEVETAREARRKQA